MSHTEKSNVFSRQRQSQTRVEGVLVTGFVCRLRDVIFIVFLFLFGWILDMGRHWRHFVALLISRFVTDDFSGDSHDPLF